MDMKNFALAASVAATMSTWSLAQETQEATEATNCSVGTLITDSPYCVQHNKILDTSWNVLVEEYSFSVFSTGGYTVSHDYVRNEREATLLNNETWEITIVQLPRFTSVVKITWDRILTSDYSVIDFDWNIVIWRDSIIFSDENWFRWFENSSDMSDEELNSLLKYITSIKGIIIDTSVASNWELEILNASRNSNIVKFLWQNRDNISGRKEQILVFEEAIKLLWAGRIYFDTIEEIVGKTEGRRMVESGWYGNFVEYYDAFREAKILEAFGYTKIDTQSPLWEDTTSASEKERVAKHILAVYRRLADPATRLMIDFVFPIEEPTKEAE